MIPTWITEAGWNTVTWPKTWFDTTITAVRGGLDNYNLILYLLATIGAALYVYLSIDELDPDRRNLGLSTLYTNIGLPILVTATLAGLILGGEAPVKTLAIYSIPASILWMIIVYATAEISYTIDRIVALDRPIGAPVKYMNYELGLVAIFTLAVTYAIWLNNPVYATIFAATVAAGYLGWKAENWAEEKKKNQIDRLEMKIAEAEYELEQYETTGK